MGSPVLFLDQIRAILAPIPYFPRACRTPYLLLDSTTPSISGICYDRKEDGQMQRNTAVKQPIFAGALFVVTRCRRQNRVYSCYGIDTWLGVTRSWCSLSFSILRTNSERRKTVWSSHLVMWHAHTVVLALHAVVKRIALSPPFFVVFGIRYSGTFVGCWRFWVAQECAVCALHRFSTCWSKRSLSILGRCFFASWSLWRMSREVNFNIALVHHHHAHRHRNLERKCKK